MNEEQNVIPGTEVPLPPENPIEDGIVVPVEPEVSDKE